MHALDRPEFMPPAPPGLMRAFGLAILAHVMLLVALTFAVNWKHQPDVVSVEAELWSAVPQQAAPKLVETPPEPEPEPKPEPKPTPKVEAPKPDPALAEAEINLKKEKKRKEEKLRLEEEKKREVVKKEAEKKEAEKLEKLKKEKEKKLADEKKQAEDKKLAQEKKRKELDKEQEKYRNEYLERQRREAGSSLNANANGSSPTTTGASGGYDGIIQKAIRDNTIFDDSTTGRLKVVIAVKIGVSGEIMSSSVTKQSGDRKFDEAVLRALQKMQRIPKDIDGRIPQEAILKGLELTYFSR